MKKILVPVDFSDLSTDVIDKAGEIAKAFGSEVYILHVSLPGPVFTDDPSQIMAVNNPGLEELVREDHDLKAMVHYLHERGVDARSALVHGPVVNTILDEAEKFEADLIVIGTQSHGFLYRTFIGSVSDGVMRNSPCPVMIVPQP
ncbi:MAG: universal stress protein [Lentimicrobium sp.]|jgi:nucleotide-binding universal stress UspA family protein|uniref:Universal stress protein n=2 Tax=root TaxID=1 RepID=A0A0S7BYZ2_9BACT|nr:MULTISPECIES: universal stress protein [Lentimicrobium]MCO5257834.1 universal stress protein [Lentimicrobium sp.]MEA5112300.1 universal stress protein [Lentimicrobium sp.]GAP42000.1 nucleotide-binding universal stress protein, UspA family [Lentimicrobium saccharophilum]